MQASSAISLSPSFNTYSNSKLREIAARVVEEFGSEEEFYDEFYFDREDDSGYVETERENTLVPEEDVETERENNAVPVEDLKDDEEEEFEFAFVNRATEFASPISADEIFHNGQIRPVYPLFNRDLFLDRTEFQLKNEKEEKRLQNSVSEKPPPTIRLPLRKLFIEERETAMTMTMTSSCSSSEADDLEGVPAESYCVWRPKEEQCKKSSSGGSNSKRWKFKDLLHRSHSDGSKGNFAILSPSNSGRKKQSAEMGKDTPVKSAAAAPPRVNREGGDKRRSYLPYRNDLVGLFANVNGLSKKLQPF